MMSIKGRGKGRCDSGRDEAAAVPTPPTTDATHRDIGARERADGCLAAPAG